jgi:hypothetical protein
VEGDRRQEPNGLRLRQLLALGRDSASIHRRAEGLIVSPRTAMIANRGGERVQPADQHRLAGDLGVPERGALLGVPVHPRCVESTSMNASVSTPGSKPARTLRSASSSRVTLPSWSAFPHVTSAGTIPAWTAPAPRQTPRSSRRAAAHPCHRCCPPRRPPPRPGSRSSPAAPTTARAIGRQSSALR